MKIEIPIWRPMSELSIQKGYLRRPFLYVWYQDATCAKWVVCNTEMLHLPIRTLTSQHQWHWLTNGVFISLFISDTELLGCINVIEYNPQYLNNEEKNEYISTSQETSSLIS